MAKEKSLLKKSESRVKLQGVLTAVAVAGAIAAFGYTWVATTAAAEAVDEATFGATPTLVTSSDIKAGTKITEEMIEVVNIPEAFLSNGATADEAAVVGRVAVVDIPARTQINAGSMTGETAASLADALPAGFMAYTVGVDAESGVASNIHQGDYVDILTRDEDAEYVLRNVRVIALDSNLQETSEKGYSTITLQLFPEDAAKLQAVQAETSTRFVLSSTADNAQEVADANAVQQDGAQTSAEEA